MAKAPTPIKPAAQEPIPVSAQAPVLQLAIQQLHPGAVVPQYATPGAACFDLHADGLHWSDTEKESGRTVTQDRPGKFGTGLAFAVPDGHVLLVFSRSGHGFKNAVRLSNCVGVIDSDYRGEVAVKLSADTYGALVVKPGDRIAQAMLVPIPRVAFQLVEQLPETERGSGGFGSTGA